MSLQKMKEKLKKYRKENILLSSHVLKRCVQRKISPKTIVESILRPSGLTEVIEELISKTESKYKLVFQLSNARNLALIVAMNDRIEVITAWIMINKWEKKVRRYGGI